LLRAGTSQLNDDGRIRKVNIAAVDEDENLFGCGQKWPPKPICCDGAAIVRHPQYNSFGPVRRDRPASLEILLNCAIGHSSGHFT